MAETFVDRQLYSGTSYKAANWTYLGITQGYGRQGDTFVYYGRPKDIYVKIMNRRFVSQFHPNLGRLRKNEAEEILTMINGVPMWYPSVLDTMGIDNINGRYVGVDSSLGSDKTFLDSLLENLIYFVDVHCNCEVFKSRPDMAVSEYSGRGKQPPKSAPSVAPVSVKEIAEDDLIPRNDVVLGIGAKGPIITKDKCVPVVEVRDGSPGKDIWIYIRKLEDASLKYALCNESYGCDHCGHPQTCSSYAVSHQTVF
jgi:hypothetical protein